MAVDRRIIGIKLAQYKADQGDPIPSELTITPRNLMTTAIHRVDRLGLITEQAKGKFVQIADLSSEIRRGINGIYVWHVTDTDVSTNGNGQIVSIGDLSTGLTIDGFFLAKDYLKGVSGYNRVKLDQIELPRNGDSAKLLEVAGKYPEDVLRETDRQIKTAVPAKLRLYELARSLSFIPDDAFRRNGIAL